LTGCVDSCTAADSDDGVIIDDDDDDVDDDEDESVAGEQTAATVGLVLPITTSMSVTIAGQGYITTTAFTHTPVYTHPFNGPFSGTTRVSRYQKGKTNLDFTEARDSEWQWHKLGHMQVCTSLQTDNHANTSPLSYLQAGCPSCRPANSVKALKASHIQCIHSSIIGCRLLKWCIYKPCVGFWQS